MNAVITEAVVLRRTNFGEADRILTVLTASEGKLSLMAKGARKPKSKLAGGIELFSVSQLTFIRGRGDIGTLTSSRLVRYFPSIVQHITRVQFGYDVLKLLDKATEDRAEAEYFGLAENVFIALDDQTVAEPLIKVWFMAQLLALGGLTPNLSKDVSGKKLSVASAFKFDSLAMVFAPDEQGRFTANHIKFLRLLFGPHTPKNLQNVQARDVLVDEVFPLVQAMLHQYIGV